MAECIHSRAQRPRPDRIVAANDGDRRREENAELTRRPTRFRTVLERFTRDNAELRRTLAKLRPENRELRTALHRPATSESRTFDVQAMLPDPCSCNP